MNMCLMLSTGNNVMQPMAYVKTATYLMVAVCFRHKILARSSAINLHSFSYQYKAPHTTAAAGLRAEPYIDNVGRYQRTNRLRQKEVNVIQAP